MAMNKKIIERPPTYAQAAMFFNTTAEQKPEELRAYRGRAKSQNSDIIKFFEKRQGLKFTPVQVWTFLLKNNKNLLLTSVRRGMTTLTGMGALIHHKEIKKKEIYGDRNTTWEYNDNWPAIRKKLEEMEGISKEQAE